MANQNYRTLDSVTVADVEALGIPTELAGKLHEELTRIVRNYGSVTPQTWHHISKELLTPNLPFSFHQMMYYGCYKDFGPDPPAWLPDPLVPLTFLWVLIWSFLWNINLTIFTLHDCLCFIWICDRLCLWSSHRLSFINVHMKDGVMFKNLN